MGNDTGSDPFVTGDKSSGSSEDPRRLQFTKDTITKFRKLMKIPPKTVGLLSKLKADPKTKKLYFHDEETGESR